MLRQFETELYFVVNAETDEAVGGDVAGGPALRVGTRDSLIVVQLQQHVGGDTVYALVNTRTRRISVPLTARGLEAVLGAHAIPLERADSAWKRR